jgi:D-3-phosphoglycerate dehydrogenase
MPKVAVACNFYYTMPDMKAELLAAYPDAKFAPEGFNYMSREGYIELLQGCDTVLAAIRPILDEEMLQALPDLKVVACCSAGLDHIDPAAFKRHGVRIGWQAGVNKYSVSELALCFMIDLLRKVNTYNAMLRAGQPGPREATRLLRGRVVGIHGCGHIGKELVKLLQPFGCKEILACDTRDFPEFYEQYGVRPVSADELYAESEVLSIHLSKNSTTRGLYTAEVQDKLRPGILLINTARGGIVDEAALKERLKDGRIGAAAFDVFDVEPVQDRELLTLPNMLATPHCAGSAREAWVAMARAGINGVTDNWLPEPGVYPFD